MPTKAQQRSDVPMDYWQIKGKPLKFGREQFRVSLIDDSGRRNIDRQVEQVTWTDESAIMTGTVQMRDQPYGRAPDLNSGGQIVLECAVNGDGRFVELWRMWVDQPERDFASSTRTFQLVNALGLLQRSTDDFKYVKNRAHSRGWRASQVAVDIAKRYRIPVGVIASTSHWIKKLVRLNSSPLEAIADAYRRERVNANKRYVISADHGRLNITPLKRSSSLLLLGPTLIDASLHEQKKDAFATALSVRATATVPSKKRDRKNRKKHDTRKIVVKVESAAAIKKYGYVHRNVTAPDADTAAEAQAFGLRQLVTVGKPIRELTLQHPGIPSIKRGDALRAVLPDSALNQVIFVTRAEHSVDPGNYTMTLGVSFTDPFVDAKVTRVKENKTKAKKRKGRKTTKRAAAKHATPKKAAAHASAPSPGAALTARGHP
jgi:hypothetical protein